MGTWDIILSSPQSHARIPCRLHYGLMEEGLGLVLHAVSQQNPAWVPSGHGSLTHRLCLVCGFFPHIVAVLRRARTWVNSSLSSQPGPFLSFSAGPFPLLRSRDQRSIRLSLAFGDFMSSRETAGFSVCQRSNLSSLSPIHLSLQLSIHPSIS